MSEDSGILISNTSIMHDDVVPRVDLGIQTISDWCTESIPRVWVLAYKQKAIVCADVMIVIWYIMLATLISMPLK